MSRYLTLFLPFLLAGCLHDAVDPFALSPSSPNSSWTPMRGNNLVSSRFCQTLLPPTFDTHELSLAQLLDIALQNNPSTKQTWAMARASAAQYGESLSAFFPELEFSSFYFRQRAGFPNTSIPSAASPSPGAGGVNTGGGIFFGGSGTGGVQPSYFTEAGPDLTLSYTLFDFGQRTAASMAAREALYYADLNHNQQIQIVLETVMADYYDYLFQIAALRANEANLANAESSLDAANQKFALGLAALGDVAQARTQYLQNKINLTSQKQAVENAFAQLAVDLGLPANVPFKVQPLPEQVIANPVLESVEQLVCLAQYQRQDFLAAQANIRSKEASLLGAQRATRPVIGSSLDVGRYYFSHGQHEDYHWTAIVSLSFPIFNGYYYRNQVRNAEANVELSRAQLMQTELSIVQHVTTSHMGVKTAAQNLNDSAEYLKAAELEFNIALSSYKAGTMTILDVISAQSSVADARSKKAGAQRNWYTSLAMLAFATGSLCATPNEEAF